MARLGAAGNVCEDRVLGIVVDLLVSQRDVINRLGLQVAERGRNQRVYRMLLVREGGGEDRRGPFGEFGDGNRSTASKGPSDGRINLHAHGLEVRQRGLELIALVDIAPFRGATAEGRRDEAASHLAIVTGAHLTDVLVETGGTLLLERLEALLEVGPLCGGIGRRN